MNQIQLIALRIADLRDISGMTAKEVAEHVGVAESTMSLYENGKREPEYKTLLAIADYLAVSVDALLGASPLNTAQKGVRIPVYGNVAAGIPIEAIEDIIDYEEIDEEMAKKGEYFGLKIKGDSMEPRIQNGDVVIVRKQETAESGDTAIILVNGNDATVKKIKITEDGITLIPNNPAYDIKFYTKKEIEALPVRIIGKVVELRGKF